jgi:hypothetical protein
MKPFTYLPMQPSNSHQQRVRPSRTAGARTGRLAIAALVTALLAACGGGGATASAGAGSPVADSAGAGAGVSAAVNSAAGATATDPAAAAAAPTTVSIDRAVQVAVAVVRVQNTGATQTMVPFTFGHPFGPGSLKAGESLTAVLGDGTVVPLQVDIKATHPDGSARHVVVSGVLSSLAAQQTAKMTLLKASPAAARTATPADLLATGLTATTAVTVDGVRYTASLADAFAATKPMQWLSGGIADEWFVNAPLKDAKGNPHPRLTARFGVRWYPGLNKQARIEFIVENDKTWVSASNHTYDVDLQVAGKSVYSKTGLTHYNHARWHQYTWWDAAHAPDINVQLNASTLINSRAVPNYDVTLVPTEGNITDLTKLISAANTGPMTVGPVTPYMPMTGGRSDIGSMPSWSAIWLLTMDKRARDVMMAAADGSGSWSIHMRDEQTDYPIRTDNAKNALISTHGNLSSSGPLPVPRCVTSVACNGSSFVADTAHEPALDYLPYLVTGDYYYLEELQFWAAYNPLETAPGYNGNGKGLLRWQQMRGQAWSLRTLGEAAYITPDNHPLKGYFTTQVEANLDWYNQTYVIGNPNNLGAYDGSGEGAFKVEGTSPWQDDFLTWSFGRLNELGFTNALPILKWKSKYPVGRMTAPGFCWIMASSYGLRLFDDNGKVFNSFADMYNTNFVTSTLTFENSSNVPQQQAFGKFSDLACASQEQATWMGMISGFGWPVGRMVGYADYNLGYPANMQPALAMAAGTGIPNAAQAWTIFMGRAAKPDYRSAPQWSILPR